MGDEFFLFLCIYIIGDRVSKVRLFWTNNELYLEGYSKVIDISDKKIEFSNYIITGSKLSVVTMDGYSIRIRGQIEQIRRKNNEYL